MQTGTRLCKVYGQHTMRNLICPCLARKLFKMLQGIKSLRFPSTLQDFRVSLTNTNSLRSVLRLQKIWSLFCSIWPEARETWLRAPTTPVMGVNLSCPLTYGGDRNDVIILPTTVPGGGANFRALTACYIKGHLSLLVLKTEVFGLERVLSQGVITKSTSPSRHPFLLPIGPSPPSPRWAGRTLKYWLSEQKCLSSTSPHILIYIII